MANEQNLDPCKKGSKEAKERGRAGGIASGKRRRERKTFREDLLAMLKEGKIQDSILLALIDKAMQGDVKAFETIRDTVGEKPTETMSIDHTVTIEVDIDED